MAKNLFEVLRTFSPAERADFRKFITSPYFNGGRDYRDIYAQAESFLKKNDDGSDFREYLLKQNGKIPYSEQTLKNRISELGKMSREFLICNSMKKESLHRKRVLLEEYRRRGLHSYFEKEIEDVALKVEEGFQFSFSLEYKDILATYMNWLGEAGKDFYPAHEALAKYTMSGYLIYLFQYCIEYEQQKLHNIKPRDNAALHIMKSLDTNVLMETMKKDGYYFRDEILIHFHTFCAFSKKNGDPHYYSAKRLFIKNIKNIEESHRFMIFRMLINYAINRMNDDAGEFAKEVFKLFDYKLRNGLIYDIQTDNFNINSFRDYVFIGLKVRKLKWTEDFIRRYSAYLPGDRKENELALSMAKVYFEKGNMEKALELANKVKAENFIYYIDKSRLRMKIFFESGMHDDGYVEIDRVKKYVSTHPEIPASHQRTIARFLKNYRFILGLTQKPKKDRREAVRRHKEKTTHEWFKKKIKELV